MAAFGMGGSSDSLGVLLVVAFILVAVAVLGSSLTKRGSQKPTAGKSDSSQGLIPCPMCLEMIQRGAVKCKHCGSMLDAGTPSARSDTTPRKSDVPGTVVSAPVANGTAWGLGRIAGKARLVESGQPVERADLVFALDQLEDLRRSGNCGDESYTEYKSLLRLGIDRSTV